MRQPSLRQIQAFKAFVETGTVSRAAEVLFISQPAASKLLSHFEQDTGLKLLDRGHGRMNITEQGMRLYEEIDRIFAGVDQIKQAIEIIKKEDHGRLTIGVMPGISEQLLTKATGIFLKTYPEVYLSFDIRPSQYIVDRILTRQFDLGVVSQSLDHTQFDTILLSDSPLIAILPVDHELTQKDVLTLADLDNVPMIGFSQGSPTRHLLERRMKAKKYHPNLVMEAATARTVVEFVASGFGVAVMSSIFYGKKLEGIVTRPIKGDLKRPVHVVRPKGARRAALIDTYIDSFKAAIIET